MNRQSNLMLAVLLFVSAACGSESVVSSDAAREAEELQEFFEANSWDILEHSGFDIELIDSRVAFEDRDLDDVVIFSVVGCPRRGVSPIAWSETGFALTDWAPTDAENVGDDIGCADDFTDAAFDDLSRAVLMRGPNLDQFDVEIDDDTGQAILRKGDLTLTLAPTTAAQ